MARATGAHSGYTRGGYIRAAAFRWSRRPSYQAFDPECALEYPPLYRRHSCARPQPLVRFARCHPTCALGADPDDGQPSITSSEGLDVKSESGSSMRSR
jgi:hypothetical protein